MHHTSRILMTIIVIIGYVNSSPVIDFQFLLNSNIIQTSLEKMDKISATVAQKKARWESELGQLGIFDITPTSDHVHDTVLLSSNPSPQDYKDILEKYGKMRLSKEKGDEIKEKILHCSDFIQTMDKLQNLVKKGTEGYIQFSQIRSLVKSLRIISFDIFTPSEAAVDFGEVCLGIVKIRKPSIPDMKMDYKEFCF